MLRGPTARQCHGLTRTRLSFPSNCASYAEPSLTQIFLEAFVALGQPAPERVRNTASTGHEKAVGANIPNVDCIEADRGSLGRDHQTREQYMVCLDLKGVR